MSWRITFFSSVEIGSLTMGLVAMVITALVVVALGGGVVPPSMTLSQSGRCYRGSVFTRVAGEPGRGQPRGCSRRLCGGVLGGLLQHRGDLGHRDDVEFQGAPAGGVHRGRTVAFDQPQQAVDLAHPGPGQLVVEQAFSVDADIWAVAGRGGDQPGQVPHCITGLVCGQISGVGGSPAYGLAGMGLDELSAVKRLDQLPVSAHRNSLSTKVFRDRVQGPINLNVVVTMNLGLRVDRHLVDRHGGGQQQPGLTLSEHHGGTLASGAVDALPGLLGAPEFGMGLGVDQVGELLAGEEVAAHVLDHALDSGFVARVGRVIPSV
nr:hypothetical protein [Mycolicibacter algericus]